MQPINSTKRHTCPYCDFSHLLPVALQVHLSKYHEQKLVSETRGVGQVRSYTDGLIELGLRQCSKCGVFLREVEYMEVFPLQVYSVDGWYRECWRCVEARQKERPCEIT